MDSWLCFAFDCVELSVYAPEIFCVGFVMRDMRQAWSDAEREREREEEYNPGFLIVMQPASGIIPAWARILIQFKP